MLKQKLLEETMKLKTISEERDSYRMALQILTKELHVAQPDTPGPNHGQVTISWSAMYIYFSSFKALQDIFFYIHSLVGPCRIFFSGSFAM